MPGAVETALDGGGLVVRAAARVAALAAASAVGLVVAAVLGDGYFEIAKHTWLAAYLLAVTAAAVLLGVGVIAARRTCAVIKPRKRRARATPAAVAPR